jgi:hypothetical protein
VSPEASVCCQIEAFEERKEFFGFGFEVPPEIAGHFEAKKWFSSCSSDTILEFQISLERIGSQVGLRFREWHIPALKLVTDDTVQHFLHQFK